MKKKNNKSTLPLPYPNPMKAYITAGSFQRLQIQVLVLTKIVEKFIEADTVKGIPNYDKMLSDLELLKQSLRLNIKQA